MKTKIIALIAICWAGVSFAQTESTTKPLPKPKSAEQIAYEELFKTANLRSDSLSAEYRKLSPEERKSSPAMTAMMSKGKEISEQMQSIRRKYIADHPESLYALKAIKDIDGGGFIVDASVEEPLFKKLNESVRESEEGKAFAIRIEKAKKLAVGQLAPIFSQPDTTGKMVSLQDFKGKYVLVDFWASWCAPCRAENPNVLKAYNKYKDSNFTVLGVSMDTEKAKAAWLKAIKDDAMPWVQISELKGWNNNAAELYDVHAIPQNYLVDPKGKIVAKNIRGEKLHETLAALIK